MACNGYQQDIVTATLTWNSTTWAAKSRLYLSDVHIYLQLLKLPQRPATLVFLLS